MVTFALNINGAIKIVGVDHTKVNMIMNDGDFYFCCLVFIIVMTDFLLIPIRK
jgi:hypothetical protein